MRAMAFSAPDGVLGVGLGGGGGWQGRGGIEDGEESTGRTEAISLGVIHTDSNFKA